MQKLVLAACIFACLVPRCLPKRAIAARVSPSSVLPRPLPLPLKRPSEGQFQVAVRRNELDVAGGRVLGRIVGSRRRLLRHVDVRFQEPDSGGRRPTTSNNNMDKWTKLVVCLLIDFIGMSTYTVPALGEAADVGWAPISALLVWYLFGNGLLSSVALVEELLPGTDIFPTATIGWILENS